MEQQHFFGSPPPSNSRKFVFRGSFSEFFINALALFILTLATLFIAFPCFIYWINKYFFAKLELDGKQVRFTGQFTDYFISSYALFILSAATFGLAFPYWIYWNGKYFSSHLEIDQ